MSDSRGRDALHSHHSHRNGGFVMTVSELAAQDQAEAREREFDRKAVRYARLALLALLPVILYAVLACLHLLPALPWTAVAR